MTESCTVGTPVNCPAAPANLRALKLCSPTPLCQKGTACLRRQAGHISSSKKFSQQKLNEGDKNTSQHLALTLHFASSKTWTDINLIYKVSVFLRAVLSSPSRRSCWPTSMLNHQPGSYSQPVYRKPASPRTRNTLFIGSPPLEAERNSNISQNLFNCVLEVARSVGKAPLGINNAAFRDMLEVPIRAAGTQLRGALPVQPTLTTMYTHTQQPVRWLLQHSLPL